MTSHAYLKLIKCSVILSCHNLSLSSMNCFINGFCTLKVDLPITILFNLYLRDTNLTSYETKTTLPISILNN